MARRSSHVKVLGDELRRQARLSEVLRERPDLFYRPAMATLPALDPAYRKMTVRKFLDADLGDAKAELVDGVILDGAC